MTSIKFILLATVLNFANVAAAQSLQPTTQAIGIPISAAANQSVLRQGTEVRFRTEQPLSSTTSNEGDRFELRSVDAVSVGSLLVIPAGSRAVGEVTRVVRKGAFGKSGKLDARVLFVIVGDMHIAITGKANDSGEAGTGGVVAAAVLFWPVMPFITGTSANMPIGTPMNGFVENDVPLQVATGPAQAPLVVPAAAAVAPVAPASVAVSASQTASATKLTAPPVTSAVAKPVTPATVATTSPVDPK